MICPNCHVENRDGAKFCDECGFPLSGIIAEVAAAADKPEEILSDALASAAIEEDEESCVASNDASVVSLEEAVPVVVDDEIAQDEMIVDDEAAQDEIIVDDDFEEEDFGEFATKVIGEEPFEEPYSSSRRSKSIPSDKTVDLSGIECLVGDEYERPMWRSGDTMEMPAVEGGASYSSKKVYSAPDDSAPASKGKGKLVAVIIALIVAVGFAVGASTYYAELWGGKSVPDVLGSTQAEATTVMESKGFTVRVSQVLSDDVEGVVLLTDPSAGSRQSKGSEVVLHVSVARVVPSLVGLSQEEALTKLSEQGFENVTVSTVKSDETEGSVLSVSPEEGTKLKAATPITVEVAVPYTVPNVVGMSADEAAQAISDAGFTSSVAYTYTEDVTEGQVVLSDPGAEEKLASGSTVTVYVARSRANELISATQGYFNSSDRFYFDGVSYEVDSETLEVKYAGGNAVTYSMTARPYETQTFLMFGSQTLYGDWTTVSGTLVFDGSNQVVSSESSPSVKRIQ